MGMIPQVFYESFVLENLDDFKNNEYCVRRGFNASISVSHLADHIYYFCKKNDQEKVNSYNVIGEYLEYLYSKCNYLKDIRHIANVYKHLYTNPNAIVDSTGAIEVLPVDYEDIEELRQEFPQDQQLTEYVIYTKKSGEKIRLLTALEKVNAMWVQEIS